MFLMLRLLKGIPSNFVASLQIVGVPYCENREAIHTGHIEQITGFVQPTPFELANHRFSLGIMDPQPFQKCSHHSGTNKKTLYRARQDSQAFA
jgi:hypothetical protein